MPASLPLILLMKKFLSRISHILISRGRVLETEHLEKRLILVSLIFQDDSHASLTLNNSGKWEQTKCQRPRNLISKNKIILQLKESLYTY